MIKFYFNGTNRWSGLRESFTVMAQSRCEAHAMANVKYDNVTQEGVMYEA